MALGIVLAFMLPYVILAFLVSVAGVKRPWVWISVASLLALHVARLDVPGFPVGRLFGFLGMPGIYLARYVLIFALCACGTALAGTRCTQRALCKEGPPLRLFDPRKAMLSGAIALAVTALSWLSLASPIVLVVLGIFTGPTLWFTIQTRSPFLGAAVGACHVFLLTYVGLWTHARATSARGRLLVRIVLLCYAGLVTYYAGFMLLAFGLLNG